MPEPKGWPLVEPLLYIGTILGKQGWAHFKKEKTEVQKGGLAMPGQECGLRLEACTPAIPHLGCLPWSYNPGQVDHSSSFTYSFKNNSTLHILDTVWVLQSHSRALAIDLCPRECGRPMEGMIAAGVGLPGWHSRSPSPGWPGPAVSRGCYCTSQHRRDRSQAGSGGRPDNDWPAHPGRPP